MRYEIVVEGRLPSGWADWCDGFTSVLLEKGETLLTGQVADQSALVGLLRAICHMNLTLVSVRRVDKK